MCNKVSNSYRENVRFILKENGKLSWVLASHKCRFVSWQWMEAKVLIILNISGKLVGQIKQF